MMKSKRRSVLVAENDRALSRVLRLHLERAGFNVFVAFEGEQASILAARQRYDLMIADLDLPDMSGLEFSRYVREDLGLADVPIAICCSGEADLEIANLVYKYGITKLFFKPINPEMVIEFAQETVDSLLATA